MSSDQRVDGVVIVQLNFYLKRLRAIEMRKPEKDRQSVPTLKELSEICGVHLNTISRISRGTTKLLNMDIISSIMTEMWRRGFEPELTDILKFELPPDLSIKKIRDRDPWAPPPPPLTRRQRLKYPGDEFVKAYAESESTAEEEEEGGVGEPADAPS